MDKIEQATKGTNMSNVDRDDRPTVRGIIKGMFEFDSTFPKLETSIKEESSHYSVQVRGFVDDVKMKRLYETFMGPRRKAEYDAVVDIYVMPSPETGKGPLIKIKVAKPNYVEDNTNQKTSRPTKFVDLSELAEQYNENDVDRADRHAVRQIIRGIFTFETMMPKLTAKVVKKRDHYNLIITGWDALFSLERWYEEFDSDQRDSKYDQLESSDCIPVVSDLGPVLKITVTRSEFSKGVVDKSHRRRRKK